MKFLCEGVQKLQPEHLDKQTDRQTITYADGKHYLPATSLVGGNDTHPLWKTILQLRGGNIQCKESPGHVQLANTQETHCDT